MELLVYKASAGSGKTFTLAVEYIRHLIINPRAYRQILAVTFTNKATAEMKERILTQLYGIWKGEHSSEAYLDEIKKRLGRIEKEETKSKEEVWSKEESESTGETKSNKEEKDGWTDGEIRQRAGMALQYMLHDYSRFRVETIDSFFQSVMRNLARELELSPNLNIELNNSEVLSDAVDSLIEKLTPTSPVLAWLLDYIDERIRDDKRWNVSNEVKSFGRNIFDESYIERGEKLRQCLRTPDTLKLYRDVLRDMETEALEQMKSFYDQFEGELEGHALTPEDLKGGARGIGSYFRKLRDGKLSDKDVLNVTLQNSLADAKNWATKTSSRKDDIIRLAETSLIPLLQDAERMRPQRNRTLNSCRLSLRHLNKLQLLNHIDEEVRTLNREHNRFLLSDTNALLHKLVREGDSSFVFEKIGANIRNVMIDEFQDTSRMQWDNFRLLLLEGLSQGADSLIVGDVKQSIYRWRNGDWGILNELGEEGKKDKGLRIRDKGEEERKERQEEEKRKEYKGLRIRNKEQEVEVEKGIKEEEGEEREEKGEGEEKDKGLGMRKKGEEEGKEKGQEEEKKEEYRELRIRNKGQEVEEEKGLKEKEDKGLGRRDKEEERKEGEQGQEEEEEEEKNKELGMRDKGLGNFPIRIETLKTNRRSETNIIRFNNQVFTAAIDYLNALHLNELKEDCLPLKRAYADVVQESPKSEERGYVKATFLEPDNEHNYTEQTLLALGEEVQRLLKEGVTLNDITILVRKNKNIPPIADYFDKELHLPVVSDEAFRLDASLAICMLMDALRCLSNPEDKIAEASLMINYKMINYQQTKDFQSKESGKNGDSLFTGSPEEKLPEAFTSRRETLRLMPLYELLEELFGIFGMSRIEKQDAYLFSFFDAVTEYLQSNSSEPDSFIRYWDETLCSKTIPSGEMDGIRILSIHKSKGLEFHTVLIPFCDWKLENETNNQLVWCIPPEDPYNAISLVPVNYSATMAESIYRPDYLHERLQLWVDNLNLLYVAFTRAGKNLILWSRKEQKGTMSELLAHTLPLIAQDGAGDWDEEAAIYQNGKICPSSTPDFPNSHGDSRPKDDTLPYGDSLPEDDTLPPYGDSQPHDSNPQHGETKPLYYDDKPLYCDSKPLYYDAKPQHYDSKPEVYGQEPPKETAPVNRLLQKPIKRPVHMESMLHDIEFRQSNRSADFIAGVDEAESDRRFINRGRLLHTLFSAIETEEDIDNAISRLVFEGVIGQGETEEKIRSLTERAFSLPQVKDWYSGTWQLFNECDIIWQENGELRTRRPDRVMMRGEEIVVVDFKFGKPDKKYNKQVQGYIQLLVRMGYAAENIRGYLWYVEEDNIEPV